MFWPTMITDNITSWMNVWLIHWIKSSIFPDWSAEGSATNARTANA
jgi:hypothetical protein